MRIYIDTSVINLSYVEDIIWIKDVTKKFFESAKNRYKLYISDIVADEIKRTPDPHKRKKLLDVIEQYACVEITKTPEVEKLADKYIGHKIIPHKYLADALHIAFLSVYKFLF